MNLWSKISQNFYLEKRDLTDKFFEVVSYLVVRIYLIVFLFFNLTLWFIAYIIYSQSSDTLIALHYNVDFGVNLIGSVNKIFVLPIIGLLIMVINFTVVLSAFRMKSARFLVHVLLFTPVLIHIFLLTAAVSIYLINFY